jgi:hypothetical protein
MGRANIDLLLRPRFCPAAQDAAAWEDKNMRAVAVNDGQLKIAIEWRGHYRFPFHNKDYLPLKETFLI